MTNVSATPNKIATRAHLFQIAEEALEGQGWTVMRIARSGKSSIRQIVKGKETKTVSIRTSQDTWVAFPRNKSDDGWATLAGVDYVVAATVDNRDNPRFAKIHMIDGDEMRKRFDRAYAARKAAGYTLPNGRGIWLSLYDEEATQPVTLVGGGAGLDHPAIVTVPLTETRATNSAVVAPAEAVAAKVEEEDPPMTIGEAKRRLAMSLGVSEADIKITISG